MPADQVRDAWARYYQAYDRYRLTHGDPYKRHVERKAARERAWLIVSGLVMVVMTVAFATMGIP